MEKITVIHGSKQPTRPHFIKDWAEKRGLTQADLSREVGADKSVVSRWFHGATPTPDWQERLAALFHCEPESLFRHPGEDWLKRFFQEQAKLTALLRDRDADELNRITQMIELTFPKRNGTDG